MPGVGGGGNGRGKGIARILDRFLGDGCEQAAAVLAGIAKGYAIPVFTEAGDPIIGPDGAIDMSRVPSLSLQAEVARWAIEHRWGKARQAVDIDVSSGPAAIDLAKLKESEAIELHALLSRIQITDGEPEK